MKNKSLFILCIAVAIAHISWTKFMLKKNRNEGPSSKTMAGKTRPTGEDSPSADSIFFDPTHLVTAAQRGIPDIIQKGFGFTEGPAVDKDGNVYFTDQPNDKIYKWQASTGQISLFLTSTGRSNGMAFDKDGFLIACADMRGEVWRIAPDGSHTVLVNNYNDKLLNGPNDVWINPVTGGIYITDPIFPRDYWNENDPRRQSWPPTHSEQAGSGKGGHVYYLAPGSNSLARVTTMAEWNADTWPNGIAGTPDGKKLYVNNWTFDGTGQIKEFTINSDGTLSNTKILVNHLNLCDGMSLDEKGNIYVSCGDGLVAFDKKGKKVLAIPKSGGTNNVFAGPNNKILFLTSPDKVSLLKMKVKGIEKF